MAVYEMALCRSGRILHKLRTKPHCLSHIRCADPVGNYDHYGCIMMWMSGVKDPKKRDILHVTHGELLPLLLGCRKI